MTTIRIALLGFAQKRLCQAEIAFASSKVGAAGESAGVAFSTPPHSLAAQLIGELPPLLAAILILVLAFILVFLRQECSESQLWA